MDEDPGVITGPPIAGLSETGIVAYDLHIPPPVLGQAWAPLRDVLRDGPRPERPVYVPGPLADDMARVVLSGGEPYDGPTMTSFTEYGTYPVRPAPHDVFDVPAEQLARWRAATEAYEAAVDEMDALIEARRAAGRDLR